MMAPIARLPQGVSQSLVATTAARTKTASCISTQSVELFGTIGLPETIDGVQGCRLVARTLKELRAGDPVEHCYGPQQGEMVTAERRRLLQAQYHFHCK